MAGGKIGGGMMEDFCEGEFCEASEDRDKKGSCDQLREICDRGSKHGGMCRDHGVCCGCYCSNGG